MRNSIIVFAVIIFLIPFNSFSQETHIYKHPTLNFLFTSSENWITVHHSEDTLIYEMMSPDSILHVMLWYTETEQNAKGYLVKMADMKGLSVADEEPLLKTVNNQEIWLFNVAGYDRKNPIQSWLVVIPNGKSETHPKENRLFIIQIWCPKENYPDKKNIFEDILNSVQIIDK